MQVRVHDNERVVILAAIPQLVHHHLSVYKKDLDNRYSVVVEIISRFVGGFKDKRNPS